jgi:DNA-damage-inducible protein J
MKECYTMATKSANVYARIEPNVKEQAENILSELGIPASNAINMFYKQIILNRGLPFEVKLPATKPVNVAELAEADLNAELEKGYADMLTGRTKSARQAFADIRKDYGI